MRRRLKIPPASAGGVRATAGGADSDPLLSLNRPLEAEYVAVGIIQVQLTHPVRSVLWGL